MLVCSFRFVKLGLKDKDLEFQYFLPKLEYLTPSPGSLKLELILEVVKEGPCRSTMNHDAIASLASVYVSLC